MEKWRCSFKCNRGVLRNKGHYAICFIICVLFPKRDSSRTSCFDWRCFPAFLFAWS